MEMNDYIKQTGSNFETFGIITKQLKNGSFYARCISVYESGYNSKPKQHSLRYWHPAPVKISIQEVPDKILIKLTA